MQEVFRVMKPSGRLFISTPNLRSLRGIRNFLFNNKAYSQSVSIYDEYDKLNKLGHAGHIREYTPREIIDFLEKIGFQPETIIYRGKYYRKWEQLLIRIFPNFRPFFSVILKKPLV
jgi:hypothetical protein